MKYSPLSNPRKYNNGRFILNHSVHFLKKYYLLTILCSLLFGFIYYDRMKNKSYVHQTLPLFQKSLVYRKYSSYQLNDSDFSNDKWQYIGDKKRRYQVYSAYFDSRLDILENYAFPKHQKPYGSIRIITIMPLSIETNKISCNFKYSNFSTNKITAHIVTPIHEHHDLEFSAFFVVCVMTSDIYSDVILPRYVGVTYDKEPSMRKVSSWIQIHYPKGNQLIKNLHSNAGIAACIAPMHNFFDEPLRIVEFVELNRILGVDRFYMYNRSASPDVRKIVDYYDNNKIVTMLNWNLEGYMHETELRYEGIYAALNDCLYRATIVDSFKYVMVVDFDEILIPFKHTKLLDLVEAVETSNDIHSFIFRNVFFFYAQHGVYDHVPKESKNKFLYSQVQTKRTSVPYPSHIRSKYIANGAITLELGNHCVWEMLNDKKEHIFDPEDALLFHYRQKCVEKSCDEDVVDDIRATKFGTKLWTNVDYVCGKIFANGWCPFA